MTYAILVLVIVVVALAAYAVLGGADFGVGIWQAITAFRSDDQQTEMTYKAIGPVWETNHVWLIFVLVLLFGAFPSAFAALNRALYVPLFLALAGIVFRGAAYAFRSQLKTNLIQRRLWEVVFSAASIFAPLFLGASIGAIASGELEFAEQGQFLGSYLTGWINGLSVFIGCLTVGLCAYSSAVFLFREARLSGQTELAAIWKRRSLMTGMVMGLLASLGLVLVGLGYPDLLQGMLERGWPMVVISVVFGFASLVLLTRNRVHLAAISVALTCSTVIVGWALSQFPYLLPGYLTIEEARSPDSVLQLILITTALGMVMLVPALWLLFKLFKSEEASGEGRAQGTINESSSTE